MVQLYTNGQEATNGRIEFKIRMKWIRLTSISRKLALGWLVFCAASSALTIPSFAQLDTLVHESFSDNRNGWDIMRSPSATTQIRNGSYEINRISGPGLILTLQRYLESDREFLLQAKIALSPMDQEKGAGLVWGHSHETLLDNYFLAFPDGSFVIQTDQRGRNDVGDRIRPSNIRHAREFIILKIHQKRDRVYFYRDDVLVGSTTRLPFFGVGVGIISFQTGSVVVDDFVLLSETKIPLPDMLSTSITRENLGASVNSRYAEIHPIISADARTLYYARKNSPENVGGISDKQDIWYSTSLDGVNWTKGKNLGRGINTPRADNLTAVSSDNMRMMFYHPTANGKGGFRFRKKLGDEWVDDEVLNLEFDNESRYVESCLSASGAIILFTAKTKHNVAYQHPVDERDIYVCLRSVHNKWSKPINLGKTVNTAGDEFSPYLAADERTLYFATNGKPGYGRVDIFMTRRLDDSWTNWSPPVNLGPEINTPLFDAYFSVPASGDFAYLVSFHRTGDTDLVRVKLPRTLKPEPVLLMKLVTRDSLAKKPIMARIVVKENGVETNHTATDRSGESKVILQPRRTYVLHTSAKGYHPARDTISAGQLDRFVEKSEVITLSPVRQGDMVNVGTIQFEQGKSNLTPFTTSILDDLANWLKTNATTVIEISGHTDNHGSTKRLQDLSEDRVRQVKDYLIDQGIPPSRIIARAYGASKPLVRNDTEAHRQMNRRVEFRVIVP